MGTVFSLDIRTPGIDPAALDRAVAWLHGADATFSTYRADSPVSRLRRGEVAVDDCPPEVGHVLAWCARLQDETGGYFSAYPDGRLDPSGFVKGWAVERVSTLLGEAGSRSHCVNGGGDVQCVGDAGDGRPWRVGIADPHRPGELIATVAGTGLAVATSGTAERGGHVLDPHTGRPATGLAAVTVVGPHLTEADAYATAAFARGLGARSWLATLTGYSALVVTADGAVQATGALADDPAAHPCRRSGGQPR
jgi:thiamine biosynthesis lipoprotein